MTYPWDTRLEDAVRYDAQHRYSVNVYADKAGAPWPGERIGLNIVAATITYDLTWTPYVQGVVTAVLPSDEALALLDPRQVVTVQIRAGYQFPDGPSETWMVSHGYLSHRRINRPDDTVTLEFQGLEYLADQVVSQSAAASPQGRSPGGTWTSTTTTRTAIDATLDWVAPPVVDGGRVYGDHADDIAGWVPATDPWPGRPGENNLAAAREIADRTRLWLRADERGVWRINTLDDIQSADPVHQLREGADGTLIRLDDTLTRDGWANEVLIDYTWTVPVAGAGGRATLTTYQATGRAQVTSGPFAVAEVGRVPAYLTADTPTDNTLAAAAAAAMLRRYVARGSVIRADAVAAYWIRAGDHVDLTTSGRAGRDHLVQSVTYDLDAGAMSLQLTQPEPGDVTALPT